MKRETKTANQNKRRLLEPCLFSFFYPWSVSVSKPLLMCLQVALNPSSLYKLIENIEIPKYSCEIGHIIIFHSHLGGICYPAANFPIMKLLWHCQGCSGMCCGLAGNTNLTMAVGRAQVPRTKEAVVRNNHSGFG